jgi:transposase-like protein
MISARRDVEAARRFFQRALATLKVVPVEVVTDGAPVSPAVLDELIRSVWHHVERYANTPIESDLAQLKRWLRPVRGLRTDRTAQVIITGHAFVQNIRRGHYELGSTPRPRCGSAKRSPNSPRRSDVSRLGITVPDVRATQRAPRW